MEVVAYLHNADLLLEDEQGVAVISGIFEGFKLQQMSISEGALREGLVYDMLGRIQHTDVREHTIQMLIDRYQIDIAQAERVENTALYCLTEIAPIWDLNKEEYIGMIREFDEL